mmetsp:Transcript_36394/g.100430  ORF Transcript_36394/g.100430 Transcript_36394/m.100430 type:complete len:113 (+) Transcript_36394:112-450(+)
MLFGVLRLWRADRAGRNAWARGPNASTQHLQRSPRNFNVFGIAASFETHSAKHISASAVLPCRRRRAASCRPARNPVRAATSSDAPSPNPLHCILLRASALIHCRRLAALPS